MLHELDKYVQKGCVVTVLASVPEEERTSLLEQGKAHRLDLRNIELTHVCGSTILRRDLEAVMRSCAFSSVLVLASEGSAPSPPANGGGAVVAATARVAAGYASSADSRTLTTLLLVSDIRRSLLEGIGGRGSPSHPQTEDFTLLGEIMDSETKDLVAAAGVSDYILSNRLMSKVMAMVSESASVGPLFEQLFAEEGDEIHVRDVRVYAREGEHLSFWELGARARAIGDITIGYKRSAYGEMVLNPPNKHEKLVWGEGDHVVVIGDDLE